MTIRTHINRPVATYDLSQQAEWWAGRISITQGITLHVDDDALTIEAAEPDEHVRMTLDIQHPDGDGEDTPQTIVADLNLTALKDLRVVVNDAISLLIGDDE